MNLKDLKKISRAYRVALVRSASRAINVVLQARLVFSFCVGGYTKGKKMSLSHKTTINVLYVCNSDASYVTGPTKIDHVSANYTKLYFR